MLGILCIRPQNTIRLWTEGPPGHWSSTKGTFCVDRRLHFLASVHKIPSACGQKAHRGTGRLRHKYMGRGKERLPKREICEKVFLFLESAIYEKRNVGKFTLLRGGGMDGKVLFLVARSLGEPPFLYAVALFKDFQDTPECGACRYSQHG